MPPVYSTCLLQLYCLVSIVCLPVLSTIATCLSTAACLPACLPVWNGLAQLCCCLSVSSRAGLSRQPVATSWPGYRATKLLFIALTLSFWQQGLKIFRFLPGTEAQTHCHVVIVAMLKNCRVPSSGLHLYAYLWLACPSAAACCLQLPVVTSVTFREVKKKKWTLSLTHYMLIS